nr:DUF6470 family protein [Pectinatus sottacetonis]
MLCLNIRSSNLILNMKSFQGKADPNMPEPSGQGKYIAPSCNLKVTPATVKIDSTASREVVGLYTDSAFSKKMAERGEKALSAGIARRMQEGREVMENGALTDALGDISRRNMLPKQKQLAIVSMPAPKITVTPAHIEGTIDPGISQIKLTAGKYKLDFEPAKVDISVKQYASIKMWVTQGHCDTYA